MQGRDVHELERKNAIERDSIKNLTSRYSAIYKPNMILFILGPVFIMSLPNLFSKIQIIKNNILLFNKVRGALFLAFINLC